jgi:Tol biopolymer transport system component
MIESSLPRLATIAGVVIGAMLWIESPASAQESRIAFVSDRDGNQDIYTLNSDGSDLRRLTTQPGVDRAPAWSPDGQQLAFVSDRSGQAVLFLMNVQSGEVTLLLELHDPGQSLSSSRMSWSPDGNYLAYTITETGQREIFIEVISVETGATKRLHRGMAPSWSPDGARLAFNAGQIPQIAVMPSGGGEIVPLLSKPAGSFSVDLLPVWSPDGASILFTSTRGTTEEDYREEGINYDVYVQDINEDDGVRLTDSPSRDQAWGWSPDGTQFVFTTNRDGNAEIYIGDIQGGEPQNLTKNSAEDTEASWGRVASIAE